jgi:hypothetical protein
MTVAGGAVANPGSKYRNAIAVRSVSGGQVMNVLTVPGVANESFVKNVSEHCLRKVWLR